MIVGIGLVQSGGAFTSIVNCNLWNSPGSSVIRDGIVVLGNNGGTDINHSTFDCTYDIRLDHAADESGNTISRGFLPTQGERDFAAYNTFTNFSLEEHIAEIQTPDPVFDFTEPFKYFHPTGICETTQQIALNPYLGTCMEEEQPFLFENEPADAFDDDCYEIVTTEDIPEPDCRTVECLNSLYPIIARVNTVIGRGDASHLYALINSFSNASETLDSLSNASPYLSNDVLQTMLESSMTNSNVTSILVQNTPLSPYILDLASQKLTSGYYQYLESVNDNGKTSERDSVIALSNLLTHQKNTLLWHLADSLVMQNEFSVADSLLALDSDRFVRETRIALALQQEDYEAAEELFEEYPEEDEADEHYKFLQTLSMEYLSSAARPSSSDSIQLMSYALEPGIQSGYAKSLAGILYDTLFAADISAPAQYASGELKIIPPEITQTDISGDIFDLYPNPTNDHLEIRAHDLTGIIQTRYTLYIYSVEGTLVDEWPLVEPVTSIDLTEAISGVYIVNIISEESIFSYKLIKMNN